MLDAIRFIVPPLVIFFLLSLLARYIGLKRIIYTRYFSQPGVYEGESVFLIEEIHNNFFLPLFFVDVEAFLSNELRLSGYAQADYSMQQFISRFLLMPFTKVKRAIQVDCLKRGYYEMDTVCISFMGTTIVFKAKAALYVYPRALPCDENNPLDNEMQNTVYAERKLLKDPFSFSGVREYRPGDPFGSINFKATAKTGELKVNQQDFFSSRNFMVYIDFHTARGSEALPTDVYNQLMETALSYAADVVRKSIQTGYGAGFAANCKLMNGEGSVRFPMGRGHSHYIEMLQEMAKIRMRPGNSFAWLVRQDINHLWNAEILIMTLSGHNPMLEEVLAVFRTMGNHVTVVSLRDDAIG